MAYYDKFVTQWATLNPGTTAAKLTQINAQTVTGAIPTLTYSTGAQIFNCINFTEFGTITAAQQTQLMQLCAMPGPLLGGSASPFITPFFTTVAAKMPLTIAALTALSQGLVTPWWQANQYPGPFNQNDCTAAGVS